jgi:maltooligosyltrehalose trehalohydrolase
MGGYGLDAQWNDDFHHSLHVLLTGEHDGYYEDFGEFRQFAKAFREGFVYSGEYSQHRRRRHGSSSRDVTGSRMVVFSQNHDQIGNRMGGERLSRLVSFEELKLAAGTVLLSPFVPLLFMGEEYGETAPFMYFTSHSDAGLIEAVRKGRYEESEAFHWQGEVPDPQSDSTFQRCKLNRDRARQSANSILHDFYKQLIFLRKTLPGMACLCKDRMEVIALEREMVLSVRRWDGEEETVTVFSIAREPATVTLPLPRGRWEKSLDSADQCWHGPGSLTPPGVLSSGETAIPINGRSLAVFVKCK